MTPGAHFLHNVPLFANLSISDLEPLAERLVTRRCRAGEMIFEQGSPGNSLYIVKSGLVEIIVTNPDGSQQTLAQFGPGQAFGEFALLDGLPRSAGARACEPSELLTLARPEFFMYLEQHPTVAINLLVLTSRRLRFAMQRTEHDELPALPLVRLARLLYELAERYGEHQDGEQVQLPLRLTQGELSGMVGCTRFEIETALETLRLKGLVEMHGLHMTIRNLENLRAVAFETASSGREE